MKKSRATAKGGVPPLAVTWISFFGLTALALPLLAMAQIVPLNQCTGVDCQACDIVSLIQNIINFALGLSIPIAIGLFSWAGVLYFTSAANPSGISKAKAIFKSAFIGFVVALGAYLIVETILHAILDKSYFDTWNTIQCSNEKRPTNESFSSIIESILGRKESTPGNPTNITPSGGGTGGTTAGTYTDAAAREQLDFRVQVKDGASLEGVQQTTIQQVNNLAIECQCQVVITEGTGGDHAEGTYSHANGYKVDVRSTGQTALNNFITSLSSAGTRSDGAVQYKDVSGNIYALESDHWDVQVTKVGIVKEH